MTASATTSPAPLTDAQYQELLAKSASYQSMEESEKSRISAATGDERANYAAIFQEEATLMDQANHDFLAQNDAIINQFKTAVRQDQSQNLKKAEQQAESAEQDEAEDLLLQMAEQGEYFKRFEQKLESPVIRAILGESAIADYKAQFADADDQQLTQALAKLDEFEAQVISIEEANAAETQAATENLQHVITEISRKQLEEARQAADKEDGNNLITIESQLKNI